MFGNCQIKKSYWKYSLHLLLENASKGVESALSGKAVGNLDLVDQTMHSLNSSAANIGAVSVQSLAEQIETLTESGQVDEIGNLLLKLSEVTDLTLKQIEKMRQKL